MTTELFIAIISFGATMYGLGYMIGQNHSNKQ